MSFSCGGGKEGPVLKKLSVCILFGGVSSEHEVSLRSAESVLNHIDKDKYNIFPVGITKDGDWILFGGKDYGMLPAGTWQNCEENRRAAISPVRGQGLLSLKRLRRARAHRRRLPRHARRKLRGRRDPGPAADRRDPLCRPARRGLRGLHG